MVAAGFPMTERDSMPSIPCPNCQTSVSDKAATCPNCGEPLRKPKGRGCLGAGALIQFWLWQAAMIAWLISYLADIGATVDMATMSEAEKAGVGLGATIGIGLVLGVWAVGSVIFGLMALLTRSRR